MDKNVFNVVKVNGTLPDPSGVDASNIIEDLWDAYVDSTTSFLYELEGSALQYESGQNAEENAGHIRRILHSIKGEAGMTGFMDVHNLCHEAESAFEEIEDKSQAADMILKVKDWIGAAIDTASNSERGKAGKEDHQQQNDSGKIKTLIIEDNPVCRQRLEMLLSDYCQCTNAPNGKVGIEMYEQSLKDNNPYKLVTLDIQMPEMDGHEALQSIRQIEEKYGISGLEGVKVIMTTSQDSSKHIFGAFRGGCEAYVLKSNMGDKLLEEMTKLGLLRTKTLYSL